MVPLAGGIIGGTVDAVATNTIGNVAYKLFIQEQNSNSNDEPEIIDIEANNIEINELTKKNFGK